MGKSGYVYVMQSRGTAPGLYKIGYTASDGTTQEALARRAGEISSVTGAPGRYVVIKAQFFVDGLNAERFVHSRLEAYRYYNEFFWLPSLEVVESAFEAAVRQGHFFPRSYSRARYLTKRQGKEKLVGHLRVNQVLPAHLNYEEGRRLLRQYPQRAEQLLQRAAGMLLPAELTAGEEKLVQALRLLGLFHAGEELYRPYSRRILFKDLPEQTRAYQQSSEAIRYLTLAGTQGDYLAWGALGQHFLAREAFDEAAKAFGQSIELFAAAHPRQALWASVTSPVNTNRLGEEEVLLEMMKILAAGTDYILLERLPPFPQEARRVLLPLVEKEALFFSGKTLENIYQRVLEGLRFGPSFPPL